MQNNFYGPGFKYPYRASVASHSCTVGYAMELLLQQRLKRFDVELPSFGFTNLIFFCYHVSSRHALITFANAAYKVVFAKVFYCTFGNTNIVCNGAWDLATVDGEVIDEYETKKGLK